MAGMRHMCEGWLVVLGVLHDCGLRPVCCAQTSLVGRSSSAFAVLRVSTQTKVCAANCSWSSGQFVFECAFL